jgi:hypothetical protein
MRSPTLTGAYLMCSGIFMALMPVLAWIPAVFFGRRAGDERYFSVGFYNVVWATTIGVVASITAVVLLTAGAIRSFPRLPRWSSPWWVLIWAAAAWLPMALLLLIGHRGARTVLCEGCGAIGIPPAVQLHHRRGCLASSPNGGTTCVGK